MSKILVAGAGHGGLVAAIHLAKNGYDITVIEKDTPDTVGHDWHDWLSLDAFDRSGIDRPDESTFFAGMPQGFRNPKATVMLRVPVGEDSICMDRKLLIAYLISLAKKAGVKFIFNTEILSPVTEGARVKGLNLRDSEKIYALYGDLVIDAAGMYSPVRRNLPAVCGIEKELESTGVFHVYRAYFKNLTGEKTDPPYLINLFNRNIPGIGWTVTDEKYVDILIGKFGSAGPLTADEVNSSLDAFRKEFPFIGQEILRGGTFIDLPIKRMLPLLVCDGYAAVGDSAGMTVPLNGSGIVLSMNAGKILAETVMKAVGTYDKKALWSYQYEYFHHYAKDLILIDKLKDFFNYVKGEQVDYLLEKEILTPELIAVAGGAPLTLTPKQIGHIIAVCPPLLKLIPPLVKNFSTLPFMDSVCRKMPQIYSEEAVNSWTEKYKSL